MPEATAQKPAQIKNEPPVSKKWVEYTEDGLVNFQKSVAKKLEIAGAPHNVVPIKEYIPELPIHVPDGKTVNTTEQSKVATEKSVPASFDSTPTTIFSPLKNFSGYLDYADQVVTGRTHVVGDSSKFTDHKREKEEKRMEFKNQPTKDDRGRVKKIVDWLHK